MKANSLNVISSFFHWKQDTLDWAKYSWTTNELTASVKLLKALGSKNQPSRCRSSVLLSYCHHPLFRSLNLYFLSAIPITFPFGSTKYAVSRKQGLSKQKYPRDESFVRWNLLFAYFLHLFRKWPQWCLHMILENVKRGHC